MTAINLYSELKKIVPWTITEISTYEKTMIMILPGIMVEIEPGLVNYAYLRLNSKERVGFRKKKLGDLLIFVKKIVMGELDRIAIAKEGQKELLKKMDELKEENRKLREVNERMVVKFKKYSIETKEALIFHPSFSQAQSAKENFEVLKNQQV